MINKDSTAYFLELLLALTEKEIKVRYKNAVLGFLWMFLNPLLQMMIIGFIFSLVFRVGIKDYYLFLFAGLLTWNFFSLSLSSSTTSIVNNRSLIAKSSFPRMVIPLSQILSNFFHFMIAMFILIGLLVFLEKGSAKFFLLPLLFFWEIIFIIGLGLLTSAAYVFYRDVSFLVQMAIMILFYATPIIYPVSLVPEKWLIFFYLNPLAGIISTYQSVLVDQPFLPLPIILMQVLMSFIILLLGIFFFKKKSVFFADWL